MQLSQYKEKKNDSINNNNDDNSKYKNDDGNTTITIIVIIINSPFQPGDFSAKSTTVTDLTDLNSEKKATQISKSILDL